MSAPLEGLTSRGWEVTISPDLVVCFRGEWLGCFPDVRTAYETLKQESEVMDMAKKKGGKGTKGGKGC